MKIYIAVLSFLIIGCSTPQQKIAYEPSREFGCSAVETSRERLQCIGKMVQLLEDIQNGQVTVDVRTLDRVDEEFVQVEETYCLVSPRKLEQKLICFKSVKNHYDPTFLGQAKGFLIKFGLGFTLGVATGIYAGQ